MTRDRLAFLALWTLAACRPSEPDLYLDFCSFDEDSGVDAEPCPEGLQCRDSHALPGVFQCFLSCADDADCPHGSFCGDEGFCERIAERE